LVQLQAAQLGEQQAGQAGFLSGQLMLHNRPPRRVVDDQDFDNPDHYGAAVLTHSLLQDRDHSVLATTPTNPR
jgi:hypothetical protein